MEQDAKAPPDAPQAPKLVTSGFLRLLGRALAGLLLSFGSYVAYLHLCEAYQWPACREEEPPAPAPPVNVTLDCVSCKITFALGDIFTQCSVVNAGPSTIQPAEVFFELHGKNGVFAKELALVHATGGSIVSGGHGSFSGQFENEGCPSNIRVIAKFKAYNSNTQWSTPLRCKTIEIKGRSCN